MLRGKRIATVEERTFSVSFVRVFSAGCSLQRIRNQSAVERRLAAEKTGFPQVIIMREISDRVGTSRCARQREQGVVGKVAAALGLTYWHLPGDPVIASDQRSRETGIGQER